MAQLGLTESTVVGPLLIFRVTGEERVSAGRSNAALIVPVPRHPNVAPGIIQTGKNDQSFKKSRELFFIFLLISPVDSPGVFHYPVIATRGIGAIAHDERRVCSPRDRTRRLVIHTTITHWNAVSIHQSDKKHFLMGNIAFFEVVTVQFTKVRTKLEQGMEKNVESRNVFSYEDHSESEDTNENERFIHQLVIQSF